MFEGVLEDMHGEFFVRKADWVGDLVAAAREGDIGGGLLIPYVTSFQGHTMHTCIDQSRVCLELSTAAEEESF